MADNYKLENDMNTEKEENASNLAGIASEVSGINEINKTVFDDFNKIKKIFFICLAVFVVSFIAQKIMYYSAYSHKTKIINQVVDHYSGSNFYDIKKGIKWNF